MSEADDENISNLKRYLQLGVLVVVGGAAYPLIYLRQNFELTILESFGITASQLGNCYSLLGVLFVVTYVPSGWLADRVQPRLLMSASLASTGLLGIWFSTMPQYESLLIIFAGWGISTGLLFWAALIKAVALLARHDEQGRFFGILDGGRGLVEAVVATIVIGLFAWWTEGLGQANDVALQKVIWCYVALLLTMSVIVLFALDHAKEIGKDQDVNAQKYSTLDNIRNIVSRQEVWLAAFSILCGYQLFWATYSFSAYLQSNYGLTAVAVATITVAKLWMRPIGAATAGFAGDFLNRESVLGGLLVLASFALACLVLVPADAATWLLLTVVLAIGIVTYAVRGIYWATLDSCDIPDRIKGMAIGIISLIGYAPDVYLPLINGALLERYPGKTGYSIYFIGIATMGLLGAASAYRLRVVVRQKEQGHNRSVNR